ncbi:site-specific integrase [Paraburkholderia sp. RL17-347-BIC-D]|uniref:hypothetical protein n=1 Tax=Paraburkholderia sp. RL17-347-BIC-D TaxID=3031632 RepID=UPI0038B85A3F
MKNTRFINDLGNVRYTVTYSDNVTGWQASRGSTDAQMEISYAELISHHKHVLLGDDTDSSSRKQVFRNHQSTLISYLAFNGKTPDSKVGAELMLSFVDRSRDYLEHLQKAPHTIADRRSHLRAWQASVTDLIEVARGKREPQKEVEEASLFHRTLRAAFAAQDDAPKTIARKAGASVSAVARWLKGATPNRRALPSVTRIERALGLKKDALRSLISETKTGKPTMTHAAIPYRSRLKSLTSDEYLLPESEISPELRQEWDSLFQYKTATRPRLKRTKRGRWRLRHETQIARKLQAAAYLGESGCPTANIAFSRIRSFLGFLCRPRSKGGMGIPKSEVMTLAWFAVPEAVDSYLTFVKMRADGIVHEGHRSFAAFTSSLTTKRTGFLVQQPEFASRLPTRFVDRPFEEMCDESYELAHEWIGQVSGHSRKPEDPIRALLASSEPLAPLLKAITALDKAAAASAPGSLQEALYKRDALLLSMLMANPLRLSNFTLMTYAADGTGNLYRAETAWRLKFEASDFKNERGARGSPYDAPLPQGLSKRIEEYLDEFRPRLIRKNPDTTLLLPTRDGKPWGNLTKQMHRFTRQFVEETPGFGPHAVRHLVATDYLRKHPNDYPTVALLLHDTLETVMATYAHLRQDDFFGRWEEHLGAIH